MINSTEVIRPFPTRKAYQAVIFDFDGTISLIREGWQQVMIPYFVEELLQTPDSENEEMLQGIVKDFVTRLTGKQTIYQCIELEDQVRQRGGSPRTPLEYKHEYSRRLWSRIQNRVSAVESGETAPTDWVVKGSHALLRALRDRGLTLYLASGTDEPNVLHEAHCLGVTEFFNGGIFGAQEEYQTFSKAMVIQRILRVHGIQGDGLLGFGDGYVEIENVKDVGGIAIGVASDEESRTGVDDWKRTRLISAGADVIVPDYGELDSLLALLFGEEVNN